MSKCKMTFTKSAAGFILKAFDKQFNEETGIAEDIITLDKLISPRGKTVTKDNFVGIVKDKNGEPQFLTHITEILDVA